MADKFTEAYLQAYKDLVVHGPANETQTTQGPVADAVQFETVMKFIEEAKAGKAELKMGGNRVGDKGYFIEPTVFTNVARDARINKEEVFGPVSVIQYAHSSSICNQLRLGTALSIRKRKQSNGQMTR